METDTREKEGYHIELTTRARRILQKRMEIYLVASDYPIARNIFTCTSGYFGIGPAGRNGIKACAIQRGDCVAIVPGVQTPMILRPRKDWLYPLVGKAYVAGIEGAPLASKKAACQIGTNSDPVTYVTNSEAMAYYYKPFLLRPWELPSRSCAGILLSEGGERGSNLSLQSAQLKSSENRS
jgi:hypothetical protein